MADESLTENRQKIDAQEDGMALAPGDGLTGKQEAFARAYIDGMDATKAYADVYDVSDPEAPSVKISAHRVLHHPKVKQRIRDLLRPVIEEHQINVHTLVSMYAEAYAIAKAKQQSTAMTNAINGMARVTGHDKIMIEESEKTISITYEIPNPAQGTES